MQVYKIIVKQCPPPPRKSDVPALGVPECSDKIRNTVVT